jgi:Flp pilus assembly protein TadG
MHNKPSKFGLLSRLRKDVAGNALVIGASALFPIVGIAGGALDIGRAYAAKTRLQTACDSAVLGGRQAMTGSKWDSKTEKVAQRFFDFNFPEGKYGSSFPDKVGTKGISFTADESGTLKAKAEVNVPTTLMAIFGFDNQKVSADCSAQVNLPDSDIMMVLDTTGSMNLKNPGDLNSRIESLRESVKAFHTSITDANSGGAKIRFGFVPYSTNVNVGELLKPEWVANSWTYQSRTPNGTNEIDAPSEHTYGRNWRLISGTVTNVAISTMPIENCNDPGNLPPNTYAETDRTVLSTITETIAGPPVINRTIKDSRVTMTGDIYYFDRSASGCAVIKRTHDNAVGQYDVVTDKSDKTIEYKWSYKPVQYSFSNIKPGEYFEAPVGKNHGMEKITWNGCIEERATVPIKDYTVIPDKAYDMDIDLVPNGNPETMWKPAFPSLVFARRAFTDWNMAQLDVSYDTENLAYHVNGAFAACPAKAMKLDEVNETQIDDYLDKLSPAGDTYHDIGMIWGARLLSPTGIFKDENKGDAKRHLIFMTDGETKTNPVNYDAYGWTALDRRREENKSDVPTSDKLDKTVEDRFKAICTQTKNRNIEVWVIAFGTELTPLLQECASEGRAFQAKDTATLNKTFLDIAGKISNLRLVD